LNTLFQIAGGVSESISKRVSFRLWSGWLLYATIDAAQREGMNHRSGWTLSDALWQKEKKPAGCF
jgi:hypothetical protein